MTSASRRYVRWFALGIYICVFVPACYTLLDHPRLAQLDYGRPTEKRCSKCHTREQVWAFLHPDRRAKRTVPWRGYYDAPWWLEGSVEPTDTTRTPEVPEVEDASAH